MNNLILCTLVGQAAFLYASAIAPPILAEKDHIQIDLNGRLDTLKTAWHRTNVEIRFLMFFPLAMIAVMPAAILGEGWESIGLAFLLAAASGFLNCSYHWIVFDRTLNRLRNKPEDYIGENAESDKRLKTLPSNIKMIALIGSVAIYLLSFMFLIWNLE